MACTSMMDLKQVRSCTLQRLGRIYQQEVLQTWSRVQFKLNFAREEAMQEYRGTNNGYKSGNDASETGMGNNNGEKRTAKQQERKTHGLTALYTNAQSMKNKQNELELLGQECKYDLTDTTESQQNDIYDYNSPKGEICLKTNSVVFV